MPRREPNGISRQETKTKRGSTKYVCPESRSRTKVQTSVRVYVVQVVFNGIFTPDVHNSRRTASKRRDPEVHGGDEAQPRACTVSRE